VCSKRETGCHQVNQNVGSMNRLSFAMSTIFLAATASTTDGIHIQDDHVGGSWWDGALGWFYRTTPRTDHLKNCPARTYSNLITCGQKVNQTACRQYGCSYWTWLPWCTEDYYDGTRVCLTEGIGKTVLMLSPCIQYDDCWAFLAKHSRGNISH